VVEENRLLRAYVVDLQKRHDLARDAERSAKWQLETLTRRDWAQSLIAERRTVAFLTEELNTAKREAEHARRVVSRAVIAAAGAPGAAQEIAKHTGGALQSSVRVAWNCLIFDFDIFFLF
jgi:hypothetical protein